MAATGRDKTNQRGTGVLLFACAGGMNVARISYRACLELQEQGAGQMACLTPLAAGAEDHVRSAREARLNVVVDGCQLECGRRIIEQQDIRNYVQIKVTDLGIEPDDDAPATDEQVAVVVRKVKEEIGRN